METRFTDPSPHINEIIDKKPNWLIRYGIGALLFFLFLFLLAAWLVKYPDFIIGKVNITTPRPPVDVIAKVNAPVLQKFLVSENDTVYKGEPILLLESTTSYHQVLQLNKSLANKAPDSLMHSGSVWLDSLGNLQAVYNSYALAVLNIKNYNLEQPFEKRFNSLNGILSGNTKGLRYSKKYLNSSAKDFDSKHREFERYQTLFDKGVISTSEFEQIKQNLLQKEMSFANDHKSLNAERMSIANLEREVMELKLQKTEYEQQLKSNYQKALNELKSQLKLWESQYLIIAQINGKLSFFNEINEGDFLTAGERILTILPFQKQKLQAVGMFPVENAGKVKNGNKVILKLDAYPYHEYGTIEGKVIRISEIPVENLYSIIIELPKGLMTNYENKIVFKQMLTAQADIITKDQTVIQRIFYQFENLFKN
ncbi:HlyD family secretion protein [Maribacter sp. 2304DJ31-5]|uniref:HlyD family secretion protein n=1 Tax=Maribacter sp. 2304DJ31-5 TaxID=3386273 RepID=UPI0039BCF3D5